MWPFKKTKKPSAWDESRARIEALAAAFAVGDWITYQGTKLTVVSHWRYIHYSVPPRAELECRYLDGQGVFRTLTLSYPEVQALVAAQDLDVVLP